MFIAHLPAGYLFAYSFRPWTNRTQRYICMVGAVLPDIDLVLFYFRDAQSIHHHNYLTHRPIFWLAILCVGTVISARFEAGKLLVALGLGAILHLLLDTHIGAINWAWPLFDLSGPLVIVPASHNHWILSFVTHWTFALELVLCGGAVIAFKLTHKRKNPGQ
ncbi:MAG: metal-dependent hydrolase [Sulfitobacter sp.]